MVSKVTWYSNVSFDVFLFPARFYIFEELNHVQITHTEDDQYSLFMFIVNLSKWTHTGSKVFSSDEYLVPQF